MVVNAAAAVAALLCACAALALLRVLLELALGVVDAALPLLLRLGPLPLLL